jgi:hypothetical protein
VLAGSCRVLWQLDKSPSSGAQKTKNPLLVREAGFSDAAAYVHATTGIWQVRFIFKTAKIML